MQRLDLRLVVILYSSLGNHRRQVLQRLRLPGRHLVRVHRVVRRNLRYRLLAPNSHVNNFGWRNSRSEFLIKQTTVV